MNLQFVYGGYISWISGRCKLINEILWLNHCKNQLLVVLIGPAMVHLHKQLQHLHVLFLVLLCLKLLVNYSLQNLYLVQQIIVAFLGVAKKFVIRQKLQVSNALFYLHLLTKLKFLLDLALFYFEYVLLGYLDADLPCLVNEVRELCILFVRKRDIQLFSLDSPQFIHQFQKLISFNIP